MHSDANQSQAEILQVLKKAGFPPPSAILEKLAPLILKGRDVVAEPALGQDALPGFILPLILGLRGAGLAPHALLLMPSAQEVGRVSQAVSRFTRVVRDAPAFVPLGEIEDARREQRRLEKGATIVAGTTERVIDHIRRGSLGIGELAAVVVQEPEGEARADFVKDVQFIFARLSGRHQTVLFSALPPGQESELAALLHHPVVVTAAPSAGPAPSPEREDLVFEVPAGDKIQALARVLLGRRIQSALVLCSPRMDPQGIARALRQRMLQAVAWPPGPAAVQGQRGRMPRAGGERASVLAALAGRKADVVVGSSLPEGFAPSHVVYLDVPAGGSKSVRWTSKVIALLNRGQEREISRLQEATGVTLKKQDLPTDNEVVTGSIDRILRSLKDDKERVELARLRSLIRRQVPLLQRPLFMAYLLKSFLPPGSAALGVRTAQDAAGRAFTGAREAPGREAAPAQGRLAAASRRTAEGGAEAGRPARGRFGRSVEVPRPAESAQEFTQLFVSIGRNRRVYARELAELFTDKLQLGAHELGSVRVFDKYSFVDIKAARADEAISRLSGSEVKGRTITVNYAKKKEEKEQH
ncbi:MAG: DEAD/DEAH box helicase [Spirochaetia bacterium]|jgi:ATP-dependent RNA helicase DeaD